MVGPAMVPSHVSELHCWWSQPGRVCSATFEELEFGYTSPKSGSACVDNDFKIWQTECSILDGPETSLRYRCSEPGRIWTTEDEESSGAQVLGVGTFYSITQVVPADPQNDMQRAQGARSRLTNRLETYIMDQVVNMT